MMASSPNPIDKLQILLDADLQEVRATIDYDIDAGVWAESHTKIDTLKLIELYSKGWLKPKKMEDALAVVKLADPFKLKDPSAYVYNESNETIEVKRSFSEFSTDLTGMMTTSSIQLRVESDDMEGLKGSALFNSIGKGIVDQIIEFNPEQIKAEVEKLIEQLQQ